MATAPRSDQQVAFSQDARGRGWPLPVDLALLEERQRSWDLEAATTGVGMVSAAVIIVCLVAGLVLFLVAVHVADNPRRVRDFVRRRAEIRAGERYVTTGRRG